MKRLLPTLIILAILAFVVIPAGVSFYHSVQTHVRHIERALTLGGDCELPARTDDC